MGVNRDATAVHDASGGYDLQAAQPAVPVGYKQTESGVIPEDWDLEQLGQLTEKVGSGVTPAGGSRVYKDSGRPFMRSQNVGWGYLDLDDVAFIDEPTHAGFDATEIRTGDVFLNITGASIGRSALADQRVVGGNVNQHVCIIRADQKKLVPGFLCAFMISPHGQRQIDSFQAGGNRQGLNFGQVRSIRIPAPRTTDEQCAIATALSDVDVLLEGLDRLIAKKRDLKQAAMQQLLTGQTRLPGFEGEWDVVDVGELATFHKGKGLPKSVLTLNGSNPCVHYGELFTQYGPEILDIISRTNKVSDGLRSVANDVLMPTSDVTPNGLAKASCVLSDDVLLGGDILVIRTDSKRVLGTFLSYVIRSDEDQVLRLVTGSTVYHLYASDMANFTFRIPKLAEQEAIVNLLSDMDADLEALEQRCAKTAALKKAMMQELLTGRTRLMEPEKEEGTVC